MLLEGLISLGNFSFSCLLVPLESFEIRHQNPSEVNVIWCLGDWHTLHDYFFRTRCIFESVSCIIKVCEGPSTNCDKSHFSPYSFFYEDGERCHTWNSTLIWIFVRISSYLLLVAGTSFEESFSPNNKDIREIFCSWCHSLRLEHDALYHKNS